MAFNFLNFNEKKTEVMIFGGTTGTLFPDLGYLFQYMIPTTRNLGFKIDCDPKLDSHISAEVKSGFFQLRQLAK